MIVFQNKKHIKGLNIHETILWLEEIIVEENKNIGDIVCFFCNDKYLLKKNIQYLNHHYLTDIITFDYCKENIISGDILISAERVKENAEKYNVPFLLEIKRVMAHGLLHLLGYKDKTHQEKEIMRNKENFYLNKYHDIRR